jgi:YjbE family integral membrane protein
MFTSAALAALLAVILLDIVLSGDNAVIIGTVAAGLPEEQRNKAIMGGMAIAVVLRIILSIFAVYLLAVPGLQLVGGLALFWVAWGMYKDLKDDGDINASTTGPAVKKTFASAFVAITIADVSMSIDNVLAVAGTAKDHMEIMIFGLVLSIFIMAFGAKLVANLIHKYSWIAWVGLALIVFVGGKMVYHGVPQVVQYFA